MLDHLEGEVLAAEETMARGRAEEIAAWGRRADDWVPPSSLGQIPDDLRERAARLLQHQLAVAEALIERITQSQRQRDVAARMSYGPSRPVAVLHRPGPLAPYLLPRHPVVGTAGGGALCVLGVTEPVTAAGDARMLPTPPPRDRPRTRRGHRWSHLPPRPREALVVPRVVEIAVRPPTRRVPMRQEHGQHHFATDRRTPHSLASAFRVPGGRSCPAASSRRPVP